MSNLGLSAMLIFLPLILSGCITQRIGGVEEESYNNKDVENSFLDSADISITDEQFRWFSIALQPSDLYLLRTPPEGPKYNDLNIVLHKCELNTGFWANPYSILTVLVLTLGNTYKCKTTIQVGEKSTKNVYRYEAVTLDYVYTGVGAFIWSYLLPAKNRMEKKERIRSAIYMYLREKGMVQSSSQALK